MKIVLTFDDGLDTHHSRVAPLLKAHNFNASFFVTPKDVWTPVLKSLHKDEGHIRPLTKEELVSLYKDGFDIGNHTFTHCNMLSVDVGYRTRNIRALDHWLFTMGIPKTTTFSYPTFRSNQEAADLLRKLGFDAARTGFDDLPDKRWHADPALRPKKYYRRGDDPLRVYTTAVINSGYSMDWFKRDIDEIPDTNHLMVMATHGMHMDQDWQLLQNMVRYLVDNGGEFVSLKYIKQFNG